MRLAGLSVVRGTYAESWATMVGAEKSERRTDGIAGAMRSACSGGSTSTCRGSQTVDGSIIGIASELQNELYCCTEAGSDARGALPWVVRDSGVLRRYAAVSVEWIKRS